MCGHWVGTDYGVIKSILTDKGGESNANEKQ